MRSVRYEGKYAGPQKESNRCLGEERHPCERDARFCPLCGSRTVFFRKGYLVPWETCLEKNRDGGAALTPEEWEKL